MRIVQITDFHIVPEPNTKLYGVDPYNALSRVIGKIAADIAKPELIVATGDLVEDGSSASYKRLRTLLSAIDIPVLVVPGNHDDVGNMAKSLIGGNIQLARQHLQNGWHFFFMNSQVPAHGHGQVRRDEFNALEALLRSYPESHVLVALHHTPLTPCPFEGCALRGGNMLFDLADQYRNLRCIIGGHAHEDRAEMRGNSLFVTTPSTFAQAWHAQLGESSNPDDFWSSHRFDPKKAAFRTLDLHNDGRVDTQVHWVPNKDVE